MQYSSIPYSNKDNLTPSISDQQQSTNFFVIAFLILPLK
nr:MAG TPA: hypothetical protein [Caudoviricetes sp.]